jgi:hypothetical protein
MIGKAELEHAIAKANEPVDESQEGMRRWWADRGVDWAAFLDVFTERELPKVTLDKAVVRLRAEAAAQSKDVIVPEDLMPGGMDGVVYGRGFAIGFFAGQIAAATGRHEVATGVVKRALDAAAEAAADEVRMALRHLLPELPKEKVAKRVQMRALGAARDVFSVVDEGRE